ncbi:MAG: TrmH family RNA methyltransferase [Kiritimatiellae bacterium]|nr:TrmH family RNA methyltransferase [Kiritimatiellia bacterium]
MKHEEQIWREALSRLQEVEQLWANQPERLAKSASCRLWMEQQVTVPRLAGLARLLVPEMNQQQLWCVLVPVERSVARLRITDVEILSADLPAGMPQGRTMPVKVVVDSIRSAFNAGGVMRTAECFGVEEVILCGYSPRPDQAASVRAALGADQLVAWRHVENIRDCLRELKHSGICCYALETVAGAAYVGDFEWEFPCALILGNERFGLDPDVVALCDKAVRIQLYGTKNSLNVVSALSVAAYQIRQSWELSQSSEFLQ